MHNTLCILFSVSLTQHNLRLISIAAYQQFIPFYYPVAFHCLANPQFYSPVDRHMGYFQCWAVTDRTVMNIDNANPSMKVTFIFLDKHSQDGSFYRYMASFLRN